MVGFEDAALGRSVVLCLTLLEKSGRSLEGRVGGRLVGVRRSSILTIGID